MSNEFWIELKNKNQRDGIAMVYCEKVDGIEKDAIHVIEYSEFEKSVMLRFEAIEQLNEERIKNSELEKNFEHEKKMRAASDSLIAKSVCVPTEEYKSLIELKTKLDLIQAKVYSQANDDGLWFLAEYATEDYLQQALRELHRVIERPLLKKKDQ